MENVQVPLLHPLTDDLDMLSVLLCDSSFEYINIQPAHTEAVIPAKVIDYTAGKNG